MSAQPPSRDLQFGDTLAVLLGWIGRDIQAGVFAPSDHSIVMWMTGRLEAAHEIPNSTLDGPDQQDTRLSFELAEFEASFVVDPQAFRWAALTQDSDRQRLVVVHRDIGLVVRG